MKKNRKREKNMEIKNEKICEKFKNLMKVRGITQSELSKETGIRQPAISEYVNGKRFPTSETQRKIIEALDLPDNYFETPDKKKIIDIKEEERRNKPNKRVEVDCIAEILDISKRLGAIRLELIELVEKTREEVKDYNKNDQTFLHTLEFLDELTEKEAIDMIIKEKKSREERRSAKNKLYLISALLDSMLMKNPNAFVVKAINGKGDIVKIIEDLKQDNSLYV